MERRVLQQADMVVAVSWGFMGFGSVQRLDPEDRGKFHVLTNGMDFDPK